MKEHESFLVDAFDLHVHSYPDLVARTVNDLELATQAASAGMGGFVLKSHYAPTAERAWLVSQLAPGIQAIGAIVLNHFVGGLNAAAVEVFARSGGRVVFMPTTDAMNESRVLENWDSAKQLPPYLAFKQDLEARGRLMPPISLLDGNGALSAATHAVLEVIREFDLVLATGHVSPNEVKAVVIAAHSMGISRILVTHPESPSINLSVADQVLLARNGASFERCRAYVTGPEMLERTIAAVIATGVSRNIASSDLGALGHPLPCAGLQAFGEALCADGRLSVRDVRSMLTSNPAGIVN